MPVVAKGYEIASCDGVLRADLQYLVEEAHIPTEVPTELDSKKGSLIYSNQSSPPYRTSASTHPSFRSGCIRLASAYSERALV